MRVVKVFLSLSGDKAEKSVDVTNITIEENVTPVSNGTKIMRPKITPRARRLPKLAETPNIKENFSFVDYFKRKLSPDKEASTSQDHHKSRFKIDTGNS